MAAFAWMEESSYAQALRDYPNFPKTLEVDVWGRPAPRPCFNQPGLPQLASRLRRGLRRRAIELDGLAWCSERPGPLNMLMQGTVDVSELGCFCPHCRQIARERGIDVDRPDARLP